MWTRCFPLYHDLLSKFKTGVFGEPNVFLSTFDVKSVLDAELKDSLVMGFGIYNLTVADMIFDGIPLKEIKACGHMDETTGLDRSVSVTLLYEGNRTAQIFIDSGTCNFFDSSSDDYS